MWYAYEQSLGSCEAQHQAGQRLTSDQVGVVWSMTPMFLRWMRTMTVEFFKVIEVCWVILCGTPMHKVWGAAKHNITMGSG
jgi:hypothetical protein